MRLGGPVSNFVNSEEWIQKLKNNGYSAAYWPLDNNQSETVIEDYSQAAISEDIIIAEVGAWSNTISADNNVRDSAVSYCKERLALSDRIGAKCCINITGSRGEQWDGPHVDNFTEDTFTLIVDTVRGIIDSVKPKRTFYTLELMPWAFPDSAESYMEIIKAVDRKQFAVHLDPVNIISSPRSYYNNALIIKECFNKLGPYIKSCHAKDIKISGNLTVHLDEVIPGTGNLNYPVFIKEISKLGEDMTLMLEHLSTEEEYVKAATNIRKIASESGVIIKSLIGGHND